MQPIPEHLHGRAFTRQEALESGVTRRMLNGSRFRLIHVGVYRTAVTPETLPLLADAATLALPRDAALSHTTALRCMGIEFGPPLPLHLSTQVATHRRLDNVLVHRYQAEIHAIDLHGRRVVEPYRTFVDCATVLSNGQLLAAGDWLARNGFINEDRLKKYVKAVHFDGVKKARHVAPHVDRRSESPQESRVRWEIHRDGLPTPEINADIFDAAGRFLARGDLVYRRWKVLVEYDGRHHATEDRQRQWDHLRREQLQAAGWRVVTVTVEDMKNPRSVVIRIRQALRQAGCTF